MSKKATLILEDGTVYRGYPFGSERTTLGEVVFDTAMTGYQEMLTDPSFAGQILAFTYPMIGNYGISEADFESGHIQVRGIAVREYCHRPSNLHSVRTLDNYLRDSNIPGISGIDTRSLTRHVRSRGAMMGILSTEMRDEDALERLESYPRYNVTDLVYEVSTEQMYQWSAVGDRQTDASADIKRVSHNIVVVDLGLKYNIVRILSRLGCRITIVPYTASLNDILALHPDGVVLSSGPGNPSLLGDVIDVVKGLIGAKIPLMGICLGHLLIGKASGAEIFKLKFGHHGGNHPVRDLATNKVYITVQSHGYAIDDSTLQGGFEVSQINLNDGTVEGIYHPDLPLISIQYHPEASPGPRDSSYLFDRFLAMAGKPTDA
ncbi:MAG: glutamine-hydrolyzing carbamoyl-phosphate synthase small subunit [Chloroflexota bacterium]|nr:glutamine-hydrolyzing carbamoyl-phosphate synthase small subunit [Chloroflexota bacterium]